jgi:hypothetical protein
VLIALYERAVGFYATLSTSTPTISRASRRGRRPPRRCSRSRGKVRRRCAVGAQTADRSREDRRGRRRREPSTCSSSTCGERPRGGRGRPRSRTRTFSRKG